MAPSGAPSGKTATSTRPTRHRPMRHYVSHRGTSGGDQATEQLNQQELQSLQSGGGAPPAPTPASPAPGASAPPPPSR
jgi:hypothetical protein